MSLAKTKLKPSVLVLLLALVLACSKDIPTAPPPSSEKQIQQEQKELLPKEKDLEAQRKLIADYLERQRISSEFDPKDSLFEEAYRFFAKVFVGLPENFVPFSTRNPEDIELLEQAIKVNPHYHAAYYVLGNSYKEIQEYEKSKRYLLRSIELKPKFQDGYLSLAQLYWGEGLYDDALDYFLKSLGVGPPSASIYLGLAKTYLEKNDLPKAEIYYHKVLEFKELNDNAYASLAKIFLKKGDLKTSWNYIKKVESSYWGLMDEAWTAEYEKHLASNNFYAYSSLGRLYYCWWDYKKAIEYLEKAYQLDEREFDQFYELGMAYKGKGNYKMAIAFLEKALRVNPIHYEANLELGILYNIDPVLIDFYQKEYKIDANYARAAELFQKAKTINPGNPEPYYYLARVYYHTDQFHWALEEARKALNIKKDNPKYFNQLGDIHFAMNDYAKALENYQSALELEDSSYYRTDVARSLIQLKRYDEAISLLDAGIQRYEYPFQKSPLITLLAEAYQQQKNYSGAIEQYHEFLKLYPNDFDALFGIASCYFDQENWVQAKNWWEVTGNINPKSYASFYNIGLACMNMEAYDSAIQNFNKALTIDPSDTKAKEMVNRCQYAIEVKDFPEKLRNLAHRKGDIGALARLMLCTEQYVKANNLWIQGLTETKYKDGQNVVSPKLYEAQGYLEKAKADLMKIGRAGNKLPEIIDLLSFAIEQRIKGIVQASEGFYVKKVEYKGQFEKGRAKMKLADAYLIDGLKILFNEIAKYRSHFGGVAEDRLNSYIAYFEEKE